MAVLKIGEQPNRIGLHGWIRDHEMV